MVEGCTVVLATVSNSPPRSLRSTSSMPEALGQLDELLATLGASVDRS